MRKKLYFTLHKDFAIDVFVDGDDNIVDLKAYVEDTIEAHIRQIYFDLMEGNDTTKIGRHINIYHEDNTSITINNDDEIMEEIMKINDEDKS